MAFLILIRFVVYALVVLFVGTQVILPLVTGSRLFPMFRKARNHIENEIRETREKIHDMEMQNELTSLKAKLNPTAPTDTTKQP